MFSQLEKLVVNGLGSRLTTYTLAWHEATAPANVHRGVATR